ncbi:retrovirus-related pol polyprotein from transposon TNT 1-94 [Tanacetum coccineum]
MTGYRSQITNFVNKFLGTIKFGNDHVVKILGYGDYQNGNVTILRVYYVEGLGHNLFSVGKFYDSNLEVVFRQHTCFIRNLEGVDLLTGSRGNNLYTLFLGDMMASFPICLLSKASKTKPWLWHRRLSHLNFGAINHLARHDLVRGLPKLKFEKDHLCSTCAMGKSKKKPHKPKSKDTNQEKLYLLHMDLYGPMYWIFCFHSNHVLNELLNPPSSVDHPAPEVITPIAEVVAPEPAVSTDSPSSTTIEAMQKELNEFERLKVWELVPRPDKVTPVEDTPWLEKTILDAEYTWEDTVDPDTQSWKYVTLSISQPVDQTFTVIPLDEITAYLLDYGPFGSDKIPIDFARQKRY